MIQVLIDSHLMQILYSYYSLYEITLILFTTATKKLTKAEKRRIKERAKNKKRLEELDIQNDSEEIQESDLWWEELQNDEQ